jgi:hypothetical protein
MWVEPDVHAWSARMAVVLRETCPQLATESVEAAKRHAEAIAEAKAVLPQRLHAVLDKLVARKDMIDGDLCGVSALGLFVLAWNERDRSSNLAIADVLEDIGSTCLQGDTHRLFALLVALRR